MGLGFAGGGDVELCTVRAERNIAYGVESMSTRGSGCKDNGKKRLGFGNEKPRG